MENQSTNQREIGERGRYFVSFCYEDEKTEPGGPNLKGLREYGPERLEEIVVVFEDLKVSQMTRRPKKKQDEHGNYLPNKASQKAGLNRSILDKGWNQLETYTKYKAQKEGKFVLKVLAHFTSQECADCGHIHPNNRKNQSDFCCMSCGHIDNADRNASLVIKKRAINLVLDTGTVLSDRGVLRPSDIGCVAKVKTLAREIRAGANGKEASKKEEKASN